MNKIGLAEIKAFLNLDGEYSDTVLAVFQKTAETTCEKVLRFELSDEVPPAVNSAIMFIVWQLYYNRDNYDFKISEIESTVAVMLSDIRKNQF